MPLRQIQGRPHVQVNVPDELPHAPAKKFGGRQPNAGRKPELTRLGVRIGSDRDPEWWATFGRADSYLAYRAAELGKRLGSCSAGVHGIVASAALAMAASRLLYQRAVDTGNVELLSRAARLAESARQHELAAWELAVREANEERTRSAERPTRLHAIAGGEPVQCEHEFTSTGVHVNGSSLSSDTGTASPEAPRGGSVAGAPSPPPKRSKRKASR